MQRGKTGIVEIYGKENLSGYLNPQECGNRTGVRTLSIHDDMQHGLTFQKASAPFEMSVLPYSAYELENAMHLMNFQVFATHGSESLQSKWVSAAMIPGCTGA